VSYAHNESPNFIDNFTFTVDDGVGAATAGTFDIVVEPYPGDYNRDRKVDAADYAVWRKTLGATGLAPYAGADGDGDGDVDTDDLVVWKAHYGEALPTFEFTQFAAASGPQLVLEIEGSYIGDTITVSSGAAPLDIEIAYQNAAGVNVQRTFTSAEVDAAIAASGLAFRGVSVEAFAGNNTIDLASADVRSIIDAASLRRSCRRRGRRALGRSGCRRSHHRRR
jgi:hypothetical protein